MIGNDNYFNSLRRGFLIPGVFFLSLFSGVSAPFGSRGYLSVATIFCAIYIFAYIVTSLVSVQRNKSIAFMMFIFILLSNGSPLTTVMLVGFNIGLFFMLFKHVGRPFDRRSENLIFWIWLSFLVICTVSVMLDGNSILWSKYASASVSPIPVRLKMMFAEPSHLGMFATALIFVSKSHRLRVLLFLTLLASQSFIALLFLVVLKFHRHPKFLIIFSSGLVSIFIYFTSLSPELFWSNSGAIRLIGVGYLFQNLDLVGLFLGHGLGAGDIALTPIFESNGVDQANGFLFSTIYDVGLIGMMLLLYCLCRNKFESFVLAVLLLNFGLGSFIFIVIFVLVKKMSLEAQVVRSKKVNACS